MNNFLWQTYHRLIEASNITHPRFLYEQLNLNHRLTGIVGPRGVGKTTLLLHYIKQHLYDKGNAFYFSADSTYFNEISILAFVDELYQSRNIKIFFIDEIHKYANWNQELKNIYDAFPDVKVIFSGSSSIDLIKGAYDLSRRAKLLYLPGLSFREYLNMALNKDLGPISLCELINHHQSLSADLSKVTNIMEHFEDYCQLGYYPTVFQGKNDVYQSLNNIIEKTIYEDIANFYNLKTPNLSHFRRILNFLASIPPGEISINNIAKHLHIDNKTADHYIDILEKTGMVKLLFADPKGHQTLTKPTKIYLDNSTLLSTINLFLSTETNIGTRRELVFMQFITGAKLNTYYPKQGDFKIEDTVFEVGGRNKIGQQLKTYKGKKVLVKDNMITGFGNEIPLHLFGFLY